MSRARVLVSGLLVTLMLVSQLPGSSLSFAPGDAVANTPTADLSVQLTGHSSVQRGGSVTYGATATNLGPAAAEGVIVRMPIQAGTTFQATGSTANCVVVGNEVKCMNFDLAANETKSLNVVFDVPLTGTCETGTIVQQANIFMMGTISVDTNTANNQSSAVSTSVTCPTNVVHQVTVSKSAPSEVTPGQVFQYAITVRNNGSTTVTNGSLADPIDVFTDDFVFQPALSNSPTHAGVQCTKGGALDPIVCSPVTLTPGQHATYILSFRVKDTPVCDSVVDNVADFHIPGVTFPVWSNKTETKVVCAATGPTFTVTKNDNRTTVQPGEVLTYTINVTNTSSIAVTNAAVTDILPFNLSFLSASDGGSVNGQTVTWNNLSINANATKTLTLQARVQTNAQNGTVITNTATVTGTNFSGTDTTTVAGTTGQVTVTKTDNRTTAQVGDTLTYVITITNPASTALTGVFIQDALPNDLEFLSATENGFASGQNVYWSGQTVNANSSKTYTINARVRSSVSNTTITNTVTVTAGTTYTASDSTTIQGGGTGNLSIEITDTPDPVRPSELLTYTIRVRNHSSNSRIVDVIQNLPSDVIFLSASDSGDDSGDDVRWDDISISGNGTRVLTVTVRVRSSARDGDTLRTRVYADNASDAETTRVRDEEDDEPECDDGRDNDNDGRIDYPSDSGCSSRNDDSEDGGNQGSAGITVQKHVDRSEAGPGESIYYSVVLRNTSSTVARNITVEDMFDSGKLSVSDTGNGIVSGNIIRWTIASLGPNETRTFTYRGTLATYLSHGSTVLNSVRVHSSDLQNTPSAVATITIVQQLPQTGAGDFTSPLENTSRFLNPLSSSSHSGIPAIVWSSILLMGATFGGRLGRRYFF